MCFKKVVSVVGRVIQLLELPTRGHYADAPLRLYPNK